MAYYVYLLTNQRNGILYTGVTSNLVRRTWQHRNKFLAGFTQKHGTQYLVWYETHTDIMSAISREKLIKRWHRLWKIRLIEEKNPYWRDLFEDICQ
ncbi:MAG: GIY-YIG nuclease family protein [Moraxellaceae bacterium]